MKYFIFLFLLFILFACEDEVTLSLESAPKVMVIDAWINNKIETQTIKLSRTQDYFDNDYNKPLKDAIVNVYSDTHIFEFKETSPGEYTWNPDESELRFDQIGSEYILDIKMDDFNLSAISILNRVPNVDSVSFTFEDNQPGNQPDGYYAQFHARDLVGVGDTYWIKSYKNDKLLNSPFDLNVAYDAGFSPGGNIDGKVFIQPIQNAVNPLDEALEEVIPYVEGDYLYVEIHSINLDAFYFLQQVIVQTQRQGGFSEIFAQPFENVTTNIKVNNNIDTKVAIGFFNMAAVSGKGKKL